MPSKNFNIKLVSIILPTYNEAENIVDLIYQIRKQVKFPKQIIVVDDNSPDGTGDLVKKYISRHSGLTRIDSGVASLPRMTVGEVRLETRYKNRGLTNSIRHGIELARGDVIVWMDCDFSMPVSMILKLLAKIEEGFDIAVGSRFVKGGGFKWGKNDYILAIAMSRIMNYSIRFLLGAQFHDYTSGFVATRSKVFKKIKLRGDYGEYFIDFIYRVFANKFKIVEVGYVCLPRRSGATKTGQNIWQYLRRGTKYVILTFRLLFEKNIMHKIP